MNRRELFTAVGALPLVSLSHREARPKELPPYWTSRLTDVEQAVGQVKKGWARLLARSAGGRPVHLVTYGEAVDRRSTANDNSACGGDDPSSTPARTEAKARRAPAGPVHGPSSRARSGLVHLFRSLRRAGRAGSALERAGGEPHPVSRPHRPLRQPRRAGGACTIVGWGGAAPPRAGVDGGPTRRLELRMADVKRIHPMRGGRRSAHSGPTSITMAST